MKNEEVLYSQGREEYPTYNTKNVTKFVETAFYKSVIEGKIELKDRSDGKTRKKT